MAETKEKWQEIANRGLQDRFDPETRAKFDEAVRRGLITMPINQNMQASQQPVNQQQHPTERELPEKVIGGVSGAVTAISDIAGTSLGGLTALVDTLNPFTNNDNAATIENIKQKFRIPPTDSAKDAFSKMDRIISPVKPVLKWLDDFKKTAGNQALDLTGSPAVATFIQMIPDIAMEMTALSRMKETPLAGKFQLDPASAAKSEINTAALAERASKKTGVDLFKAQKTLNPTDLERQSFVAQLPAGAVKAREALSAQNSQALKAVDDILSGFASPESVGTASTKFRSAAQAAVEKTKQIRREYSSPIYKQAFRRQREGKVSLIDTSSLETKVNEMAKQFDRDGQIAKNLNMASKKISGAKGDLQKLHAAKLEIDQTINSFGEGAIGNTTKRFLTDVVKDLTDNLTTQSPSYRAAKSEFERLSGPVNKIQDSQIGKIANMDDVQLKMVAQKIFDPSESNPSVMLNAKKAINEVDKNVWSEITRAELERRMGRIRADIGSADNIQAVENIPSQLFNSVFGNKKSRDILYASVNAEQKANLKYLETVLKRASTGRPGGSQTGIRAEISKELRGGAIQAVRDFIKGPISKVSSIGEDAAFEARVRALSYVMFDPSWTTDMRKLRSLDPSSDLARKVLNNALNSAIASAPVATENNKDGNR